MSDQINYAFPSENDQSKLYHYVNKGMTLRDYFAAKVMHAILASGDIKPDASQLLAHEAYKVAESMLIQSSRYKGK